MVRGGDIIKAARKARGMTQAEVSCSYGYSVKTIQRWESCITAISFDDALWIITDVFKMPLHVAMELVIDERH
jgi:transcriptional regulator with XRE-family HTH domain